MRVIQEKITLELSEREVRLLAFSLHEYIWAKAKDFKKQNPKATWQGFKRLHEPSDTSSNDMFEMWSSLAKFWKQESIDAFEQLIKTELKLQDEEK